MYRNTLFTMLLCSLLAQCSDQKKDSVKTTPNNNPTNTTTTTTEETLATNNTTGLTGSSGDLTGTWKLQLDAYDDNNNGLLDPEERAKASPNNTSYQFKPDGSCVIQGMFKGRYELKKQNGKDNIIVYRARIPQEEDKDPEPEHFRILALSTNELVLLLQEGYNENTIWIFKRV